MASIIGQLRVVLSAETAQFSRALKDSQSLLQAFGNRATTTVASISAAFVGMSAAVALAVTNTLSEATRLAGIAQSIGIPIEKLSELKHAADQTGVSFDNLSSGMQELTKNIAAAASDARSQAGLSFEAIGVSVTDANGKLRSAGDVLQDLAKRFATYREDASKSQLATQLFGSAGAALIPLLNQGADGIDRLGKEARDLGVVISGDTVEAAKRYNEALDRMGKLQEGINTQITNQLAPTLQHLASRFEEAANQGGWRKWIADGLEETAKRAASVGEFFVMLFRNINAQVTAFAEFIGYTITGRFKEALETMGNAALETRRITKEHLESIQQIWAEASVNVGKWANAFAAQQKSAAAPIATTVKDVSDANAAALAELQAYISAASMDIYGKQAAINQALADGIIKNVDAIKLSAQVAAEAMRQIQEAARAAWDEIIAAPTETYAAKMQATKDALDKGTISLREYGRTTRQIQQQNVQHWNDLASAVSSGLTTIFAKSKTAAIAAAVINTAQGITRNLAQYPQPFAGIMAAITAAAGAAQIRAIRSTSQSGSSSTPSASAPATPTIPQQQTLFVQGINPSSLFTGDAVRELATKLIDYQRDGGKVVITQ